MNSFFNKFPSNPSPIINEAMQLNGNEIQESMKNVFISISNKLERLMIVMERSYQYINQIQNVALPKNENQIIR
jgi:hypothetical protein